MKDNTKRSAIDSMPKNVMYGTTDIGASFSHSVATAEFECKDETIWLTVEDLGDDILFYAYNKDIIYRCFINDPADKEMSPSLKNAKIFMKTDFLNFCGRKTLKKSTGYLFPGSMKTSAACSKNILNMMHPGSSNSCSCCAGARKRMRSWKIICKTELPLAGALRMDARIKTIKKENIMKIREAIDEARRIGDWPVTNHEPTSVNVRFVSAGDVDDETQLDLYGDTPEKREEELEELWNSLYVEFEAASDAVTGVEALGYIAP